MIHLTINTGHVSRTSPDDISSEALAVLRPIVANGGGPVPGFAPWRVVIASGPGAATFDIQRGGEPAVLCGLAWIAEGAGQVWPMLERIHLDCADQLAKAGAPEGVLKLPDQPADLPWLAALILPSGLLHTAREDLSWMGDFERCLAFAIIQRETGSTW